MDASERTERRRATPFAALVDRVESASALDGVGKAIAKRVRAAFSPRGVKDALSGTWLGHAVHPMLTDVVIGSFLGATVLEVLGDDRDERARRRLIGIGLAAAAPTALTGANDWADAEAADDRVRRAGLVHGASNTTALSLYAASLAVRRRGGRRGGALLALGGATALLVGGYLGGHLSFARGVGPDQTVYDPGPDEWAPATDAAELAPGRPTRVVVNDTPVLLLAAGDRIYAIHDRCSHRGCSLTDGQVHGDDIVCACHGSRFSLSDGSVRHGPASAPQPAFEVRERDGRIEVRRRAAALA